MTPRYLLVGPAKEALAKKIVEAEIVAEQVSSAVAGVSNVSPARALQVRVSNRIVGAVADQWYIIGEKATVLPVVVQQRKIANLTRLDRDEDPNVFMRNEFVYGTHARGEGFLSLPFLAYAGGFSFVADFAAA